MLKQTTLSNIMFGILMIFLNFMLFANLDIWLYGIIVITYSLSHISCKGDAAHEWAFQASHNYIVLRGLCYDINIYN